MTGKRARRPTRTVTQPVRLTDAERARADKLVKLYGGTISDVLRAGIGALEREHAELERRARNPPSSTDTDG